MLNANIIRKLRSSIEGAEDKGTPSVAVEADILEMLLEELEDNAEEIRDLQRDLQNALDDAAANEDY